MDYSEVTKEEENEGGGEGEDGDDPLSYSEFSSVPTKSRSVHSAKIRFMEDFVFRHRHFLRECCAAHNNCRRVHDAPPLTVNRKLCEVSLELVEHLCALGRLKRRRPSECVADGEKYDQNLFMIWPTSFNHTVHGSDPVDFWYNGGKDYAYGADPRNIFALPFAQIIWKETSCLGAGISINDDGKIFAVVSYSPPGNVMGQYAKNVTPRPDSLFLKARDVALLEAQLYSQKQCEGLRLHNEMRSLHGVPSLSLDPYLIRTAMEWARRLCEEERHAYHIEYSLGENIFAHDCTGRSGVGSLNKVVAMASGWGGEGKAADQIGIRSALNAWYSEKQHYEFGTEPHDNKARNFTQMVWRSTRRVGMALAYGHRGRVLCVANYFPRGNITGYFAENVPPPCAGKRVKDLGSPSPDTMSEKRVSVSLAPPTARSVLSKTSRITTGTNIDEVDIPMRPKRPTDQHGDEMSNIIW